MSEKKKQDPHPRFGDWDENTITIIPGDSSPDTKNKKDKEKK